MKKSTFTMLGALTLTVPLVTLMPPAEDANAHGECACLTPPLLKIITQLKVINVSILQQTASIVEVITLSTQQITGEVRRNTKATEKIADANNQLRADLAREVIEAEAARRYALGGTICEVATGVSWISGTSENARATTLNLTENMRNWSAGHTELATGGTRSEAKAARLDAWSAFNDDPDLSELDVDARIFAYDTLSDAQLEPAQYFIRNTVDPNPAAPLTAQMKETAGGKAIMSARLSRDAKKALAALVFNTSVANRREAAEIGEWAKALRPNVAGSHDTIPDKLSLHELLKTDATWRYGNAKWITKLQTDAPEAVARERTIMLASQTRLMWEMLEIQERNGLMLAAILADQVDGQFQRSLSEPIPVNDESTTPEGPKP